MVGKLVLSMGAVLELQSFPQLLWRHILDECCVPTEGRRVRSRVHGWAWPTWVIRLPGIEGPPPQSLALPGRAPY